ncbi:hypothetical protein BSKO_05859 [Bryopsis sp. KO-2023]|nr:hypothetical protein BSKO_05859 [Bryopsis sp. KO-2023]
MLCAGIPSWKKNEPRPGRVQVSSLIEIVTLLGNLPTNKFIVANITEDIEFVDLFFPEDGFVITRQRLLLDGDRGSSRSKITLKDGLGQVFYLIFNGRLEIANMDVIIDNCGLREAREFSAEGDHRLPIEEQLRDPAYGSEWGYFIPIEFINSPPTPDSRTTLKNTRVVCKTCGPISFTNYGQALMKSNITKFEDLAPDLGYRAKSDVDGIPVSASFPVRYKANEKNLIKRTSAKTITIEYLEVVSPFDEFATSVALELVNVTLECEQIEKDPERQASPVQIAFPRALL